MCGMEKCLNVVKCLQNGNLKTKCNCNLDGSF